MSEARRSQLGKQLRAVFCQSETEGIMFQYPMKFQVSLEAGSETKSKWTAFSEHKDLLCAIPPEFDGPGGGLSPEDLFAHALLNCFAATFLVMAERSGLSFSRMFAEGSLTVDRDESKRPVMKSFHFEISLYGCDAKQRAESIVKKAIDSGFILNSVKTTLSHHVNFFEKAQEQTREKRPSDRGLHSS